MRKSKRPRIRKAVLKNNNKARKFEIARYQDLL